MKNRHAFTLLEIMIAIVILSIALTLAWQTFAAATRAWTHGRRMIDQTHQSDFVMNQLAAALRSMVMFENAKEKYAFIVENTSDGQTISWVTASGAFVPRGSGVEHGLHRIAVGAGRDEDGVEGLLVSTWPYMADEDEIDPEKRLVSEDITSLRCNLYDLEEDRWVDTWEYSNQVPGLIEITLTAEPIEGDEETEIRQLIEIPLGPAITNDISAAR